MYDIIFDFSSSPTGGSFRRIEAYAVFFSNTNIKTLFLLHPKVADRLNNRYQISVRIIRKTFLNKFFSRNSYLNIYRGKCRWLFSYGIPVSNPIGEYNWFHISNILPFNNKKIKLSLFVRVKSLILYFFIARSKPSLDVISAESHFSLDLSRKFFKDKTLVHLNNGFLREKIPIRKNDYNNYAIAIGTAKYKRIDKTYNLFLRIKEEYNLGKLIIVGLEKEVPRYIKDNNLVKIISKVQDAEYFSLLANSSVFISTSEIENSSVAVMEALQFSRNLILSNIPSHSEIYDIKLNKLKIDDEDYLIIKNSNILINYSSDWTDIISRMLKTMKI